MFTGTRSNENPSFFLVKTREKRDMREKKGIDYSTFGAPMPGRSYQSTNYRYGFNGKEKVDEMHNNSGDSYDFGARIYDARLGRFLSIDPLASSYPWFTPYQFASNNPIAAIDMDGLNPVVITTTVRTTQSFTKTTFRVINGANVVVGVDHITTFTMKTYDVYKEDGSFSYTVWEQTVVNTDVDEFGNIGNTEVTFSSSMKDGAGPTPQVEMVPVDTKEIPLSETSAAHQAQVNGVANFKKNHSGISNIQVQAKANEEQSSTLNTVGIAIDGAGVILLTAPEAVVTKIIGAVVEVAGLAIGLYANTIETDPEKIRFTKRVQTTEKKDSSEIEFHTLDTAETK